MPGHNSKPTAITSDPATLSWQRYLSNPIRHLGELTADTEKRCMAALSTAGFEQLTMAFSAPLTLIARQPMRLTELACALGISKQLCLQALRPIRLAGYILESPDPNDGRAKQIRLSSQGQALIAAAGHELMMINREFTQLLGQPAMTELSNTLRKLALYYRLPSADSAEHPALNYPSMVIGMLNRRLHQRLTEILADRGYPDLQLSFAQVLTLIDSGGTTMSYMAEQQGVSVQAISRIAGELQERGFIERRTDSSDRRSKRIFFSQRGQQLIEDSVAAMTELEAELSAIIGRAGFEKLEKQLLTLHRARRPTRPSAGAPATPTPPSELLTYFAQRLQGQPGEPHTQQWLSQQLGSADAETLQRLLSKLRRLSPQ